MPLTVNRFCLGRSHCAITSLYLVEPRCSVSVPGKQLFRVHGLWEVLKNEYV